MKKMRLKLIFAGIILTGAVGFLASAGIQKGWIYSLKVDQFIDNPQHHGQRVRLEGNVAEEGFEPEAGLLVARFILAGEQRTVPVVYHGAVPDMFKAGHPVVVEGKLDEQGVFQANVLLTKCASKYEEEGQVPAEHPPVENSQ